MHLPINKAQGCNKGGKEAAVTQEETDAGVTAGGETAQHQSTATAHSDKQKQIQSCSSYKQHGRC